MAKRMKESIYKRGSKSIGKRMLKYGMLTVLTMILMVYLLGLYYYNNHFYTNTVINGISASNMTVKQVEGAIDEKVKSYILTLEEREDKVEQISGEDISLYTVFDRNLSELLEEQSSYMWPISFVKTHGIEVNTSLDYDESLLKEHFNQLECFNKENMIEPENAYISKYSDRGFEIIPEEPGAKVIKEPLYEAIKKSIIILEPSLSLEEVGCYEEAKVKSDHPKLTETIMEMNKIAGTKITYEFGDVTEIVDGKRISEWITVNKDDQVDLDVDSVKEFVDYIGKKYNSFGRVRSFKTTYGDVLQISGGDYGWWLNRPKEVSELTELILDGKQEVRKPAYFQTARQHGTDDIGDTYVELNLTAQHLFFYKDGKLIVESDFVSGNIVKNNGTPTGTYPIQYKENDATLVGEDYATPVKYWMPFNGNIGLHDASWRGSFGKEIYKKNGSHGCINMPPEAAKKVFEYITRGVAVVVYELEGSDNIADEKDENIAN